MQKGDGDVIFFGKNIGVYEEGLEVDGIKYFLVAENEEMAKSISGRIEWLSSFGSIVRFDAVSSAISPNQQKPITITPSQERVPEGEKIRKEEMRKREEKLDRYNRPKKKEKEK